MRAKRDSDRIGKARSNEYKGDRLSFLRKVYMESHSRIEAKFLAMIRAHDLSSRDKQFSLMSYREGAVEMLSAVERIFGAEGLHEVSNYLRMREDSMAGHKEDEEECDEEGDEEGGDDYVQTPIDDTPWTYEKVDPKGVGPRGVLERDPALPLRARPQGRGILRTGIRGRGSRTRHHRARGELGQGPGPMEGLRSGIQIVRLEEMVS